jgi:hypothetical protein
MCDSASEKCQDNTGEEELWESRKRCHNETPCIAILNKQNWFFFQKWRTGR